MGRRWEHNRKEAGAQWEGGGSTTGRRYEGTKAWKLHTHSRLKGSTAAQPCDLCTSHGVLWGVWEGDLTCLRRDWQLNMWNLCKMKAPTLRFQDGNGEFLSRPGDCHTVPESVMPV